MNKYENGLWQAIKAKPKPGDWHRVEAGLICPGLPDVNACVDGHEFWLELKAVSRGFAIGLRREQVPWILRRCTNGGTVWVVVRLVMSREIYLYHGLQIKQLKKTGTRLDPVVKCAREDLDDLITFLCSKEEADRVARTLQLF